MAHEIGHNFAPRTMRSPVRSVDMPSTFIMNPFLLVKLQQFSSCSKTEIAGGEPGDLLDAFTPGPSATPTATFTRTLGRACADQNPGAAALAPIPRRS